MKRNGNAKRFGLVWVFALVCGVVLVLMCCQEMMAEEPADGPGTDGNPPAAGSKTPATAAEAVPLDQEEEDAEEEEDEAADEDEDEEDDEDDDEYDREEAEGRRIEAEQGDAEAQYTLGGYYEGGLGVERNLSEAVKWYRKAAEQGYVDAQIALGECYYDGDGVEKNRAEAVKWWRKAAEKEELPAFYAAECDESKSKKDEDVGDDLPETVRKFLPAAKRGDVNAQIALGEYYEKRFDGESVYVMLMTEKDYKEREKMIRDLAKTFGLKAFRWYRKAAEQGSAKAQFKVGDYYTGGGGWVVDILPKIKWYLKAAEQGYTPAMVELAMCSSYMGSANKPAFQWYREAAELGDATAQFALGKCYEDGDGVVQNLTKAIEWYRKAAEQGNGKAQFALGLCYEGDRVEQNLAEAVKWYQKTAENEDTGGEASEAMYHLALCYENGKGVEKDLTKAFKLYKRSVESVYFTADFWKDVAYHLARCYENGIGVEKDLTKAIEWYRRAAERGSHEAKDALKRLGK